eukprot:scaffold221443_cov31-Tisochrysis_lutea.AAC.1
MLASHRTVIVEKYPNAIVDFIAFRYVEVMKSKIISRKVIVERERDESSRGRAGGRSGPHVLSGAGSVRNGVIMARFPGFSSALAWSAAACPVLRPPPGPARPSLVDHLLF